MEFLPQQPDAVRERFALAAREIPGITRPDALLALILRAESTLPAAVHPELHVEVAQRARAIDTRVLEVIARSPVALAVVVDNAHLDGAMAEWLAVRHLASIVPATSMAEWERNRTHRGALQRLLARRRLSAGGLAGQVLFREACAGPGEQGYLAQQALSLYLHFPDVPALRLERLGQLWHEHAWGCAQVERYRPGVEAMGRE